MASREAAQVEVNQVEAIIVAWSDGVRDALPEATRSQMYFGRVLGERKEARVVGSELASATATPVSVAQRRNKRRDVLNWSRCGRRTGNQGGATAALRKGGCKRRALGRPNADVA